MNAAPAAEYAAAGEAAFGYRFRDPQLLRQALTHSSGAYERLEFLGDRVLGVVIAEALFKTFPAEPEGALSRRFGALVRRDTLAAIAAQLGVGDLLVLARGEDESGGRRNPAILADACEAVIGAIHLDGGHEAAQVFILRHWTPLLEAPLPPPRDAKTALQEWAQAQGRALPLYRTVSCRGPDHDPTFEIAVSVDGVGEAIAEGPSKRVAEQAAAARLLERAQQ